MILERPGYRWGAWGLRQAMVLLRQPLRKLSIMAVIIFTGARSGMRRALKNICSSGKRDDVLI